MLKRIYKIQTSHADAASIVHISSLFSDYLFTFYILIQLHFCSLTVAISLCMHGAAICISSGVRSFICSI